MDRVGEIISRVERRRKWTAEQKAKILAEALEPGVAVSAVADRNGISRSQLYCWKKLARQGRLSGVSLALPANALFAPVRITDAPAPIAPVPPGVAAPAVGRTGRIEIALRNGRIVRAEEAIEPGRLACLIAALEGSRS